MNQDLESEKYEAGSELEAATLMSSHTLELTAVECQKRYSNHMRRHHARYGRYFNDTNQRCGKVAQDRPITTLIADEQHNMKCVFYIHSNPHRANIPDAERYEYSTHKLYGYGRRSVWMRNVRFPTWYLKLGRTALERQKKYRTLFARYLKANGLKKQTFLQKRFFGPLAWIHRNEKQVSEWRKSGAWGPGPDAAPA